MTRDAQLARLLLVEDNPADVMLVKEAMRAQKLANPLDVVSDGVAAIAFLRREAPYADARRPDLILLDLNLPRLRGERVLEEIKADPDLRRIPVIVMTSSRAEEDVVRTYDLHANCYVQKPIDFEQFSRIVESLDQFWFSIVTLPPAQHD